MRKRHFFLAALMVLAISGAGLYSVLGTRNTAGDRAARDAGEIEALRGELKELRKTVKRIKRRKSSARKKVGEQENLQRKINTLVTRLAEGDIIEQYQAGMELKNIGKPAVPRLIEALKGGKKLRRAAMVVLGQIKDESVVPVLIAETGKIEDEKLRAGFMVILGRTGDKRASPILMEALGEDSEAVVGAAAYALGKLGEEKAVDLLIPLLSHGNEYVRKAAVQALGEIGEPAVAVLSREMNRLPLNAKYLTTNILGEIGGKQATNALLQALKDDNEYIRLSAAESLSKLGNASGYELSLKNMNSARPEYQAVAKKTLKNLGKKVVWNEREHEYVVSN